MSVILVAAACLATGMENRACRAEPSRPPNIVIIFADDLG